MSTSKPNCPVNALSHPTTQYASYSGAYSEIKYTYTNPQRSTLPSEAESAHNQFNYGQRYDNPNFVRGVETTCRFVLASGAIRDGLTLHTKYGPQYIENLKTFSFKGLALNGGVSALHIGLSGASSMYGAITLVRFLSDKNTRPENIFGAAFNLVWHTSDFLGDVSEELDRLTILAKNWKYFSGLHKITFLGKASFGLELLSTIGSIQELRSVVDSKAPTGLKVAAITETSMGALSSLTKIAVDAMWIDKVRSGLKLTGKAPFIALGAAIVGSVLHPLQFYSIHKEFDYAKRLDALAEEFKAHGYDGHKLLADLYKNKAIFDTVTTSLQTLLSLGGGAISLAMMGSVIGAPLGIAVQLITATLSGIIDLVSQPAIEAMAKKQRDAILKWEKANGGKNYFSNQLDVYYEIDKANISKDTLETQNKHKADRVINIHQVTSDAQARELAALTQLAERSLSGRAYIDVFKNGVIDNAHDVSLDSEIGIIELSNSNSHARQVLTFTQPLLTPGKEIRTRNEEGKNKYKTSLKLSGQGKGWKVIDKGATETIADFSKIIQRIQMKDGTTKEIAIHADMGQGNDLIKASQGAMNIDGGYGVDVVDYSALSDVSVHLEAQDDGSYAVTKKFTNGKIYTEDIISQQFNYGKRTESIEYRDIFIRTAEATAAKDILISVEEIVGSTGKDHMVGGKWRDVFYGHGGDDTIFGLGGDDVLRGGYGNDKIIAGDGDDLIIQDIYFEEDFICGGQGTDTVDYSETKFIFTPKDAKGIVVNLAENGIHGGIAKKYIYRSLGENRFLTVVKQDTLKHIENIVATTLNDEIYGDATDNAFYGLEGNDKLYGRGGKDKLFGGSGINHIDGGDDNDEIYIETVEGSTLIGGKDIDTVNASLFVSTHNTGLKINLTKKWIKQIGVTHTNIKPYDKLDSIENVVGTKYGDFIFGDEKDNQLYGGGGKDTIDGKGGKDEIFITTIEGSTINGGEDEDTVNGRLFASDHKAGLEINLAKKWSKRLTATYDEVHDWLDDVENTIDTWLQKIWNTHTNNEIYDKLDGIENVIGTEYDDIIYGDGQDNKLSGGAGKDTVYGGSGNDLIFGGDGDDAIYGGKDNDVLYGGKGKDKIFGNQGNDEIYQNFGIEEDFIDGGKDDDTVDYSLSLRHEVSLDNQTINKNGIEINLEKEFAKRIGTDDDAPRDTLKNIENIIGTGLNDKLIGNDKSNFIVGGDGDDNISGGRDNDVLKGGNGSDTYLFKRGDGQDIIIEEDSTPDNIDCLKFDHDINQEQLWLTRNGDDLIVRILGTEDQITVTKHFVDKKHRLEKIALHNKHSLSDKAIDSLVEEMAKLAIPHSGEITIPSNQINQINQYWASNS